MSADTAQNEQSYFQQRMDALGVTAEQNTINLWFFNSKSGHNELGPEPIFRETDRGIDILVYTIDRRKISFAKEGSRWKNKVYCITRLAEPKVKPDGSIQKYDMPKGQPTLPFFPPMLVTKYDTGAEIPVLYLTEGYFKAFKAGMHGIDCVGLPSITCMKDKETGALHEDVQKLIIKCKVQRIVWLTDGDCRNISGKDITDGADLYKRPWQFFRTVDTFQNLLSAFDNVKKYFAHINSEGLEGEPKGLDDLLCAFPGDIEAIVKESRSFDKVKTGALTGTYFVKMDITYGVGQVHRYFHLADVDLFYLHHVERRPDLRGKDFKFNGTLYAYDEQENKCAIKIPRDASLYFRVGDKYYEYVDIPNRYGTPAKTFHRREKETIKDDNGPTIFKHIPKYKSFCVVPDHTNYQRVIHNCFNIYHPFEHEPEEGEYAQTLDFIKHIFGSEPVKIPGSEDVVPRYELGLDYITLLYKKPQQILPILCLVSNERQTGKTTFAKWLAQVFTENMAIVGNEDLAAQFNAHWSSKLLICCDETKIDKHVVMEKVKSLSTASSIMMNAKGRDQVNMEFFGKFLLLSNNEENFAIIDREEIRFWVIKVPSTQSIRNTNLLEDLQDEIPAFLHFLNTRKLRTENRERHWFATALLHTEALDRVVANSRPNIEKQLRVSIEELFDAGEAQILTLPLDAITSELLKKRFDKDYVKRTLHKMGYKTSGPDRRSYPRLTDIVEPGGWSKKAVLVNFHGRYYEFHRNDFLSEEHSKSTIEDLPF